MLIYRLARAYSSMASAEMSIKIGHNQYQIAQVAGLVKKQSAHVKKCRHLSILTTTTEKHDYLHPRDSFPFSLIQRASPSQRFTRNRREHHKIYTDKE